MSGTIFSLPIAITPAIQTVIDALPAGVDRVLGESLHITLAVLPDASLLSASQSESLDTIGATLAALHKPIDLRLTDLTMFPAQEGADSAPVILLVESIGVTALRNALLMACAAIDVPILGEPIFVPHLTLGYGASGVIAPTVLDPSLPITASQLGLWIGPSRLRYDLTGTKARPRITGGIPMADSLPAGVELKAAPHYTKSITDRTVVGIFSVFGNRDSYDDIIEPGAFLKTFRERGKGVLHLWQHDCDEPPIARVEALRELTRAELPAELLAQYPDATGGAEVTRTYLPTPRAEEVFTNIVQGVPLQMSFMFDPVTWKTTEDDAARWGYTRRIQEVRLWETSDVNWGANAATMASKRFGRPAVSLDTILSDLDKALTGMKAGSRHSTADMKLINSIHSQIVGLGCSTCAGDTTEEDAKAIDALADRLQKLIGDLPTLDIPSLAPLARSLRAMAIDDRDDTERRAADDESARTQESDVIVFPVAWYQQRLKAAQAALALQQQYTGV